MKNESNATNKSIIANLIEPIFIFRYNLKQ